MFAVAKAKPSADVPHVEANTPDWRKKIREEIARRPRGTHSKLAKHLGISTGHLTEILSEHDGASPDQQRYTRHKRQIDEWLWPPLLPLSNDTLELQHLIDGVDRDLLRLLKDMSRDQQRKFAEFIIATRKAK